MLLDIKMVSLKEVRGARVSRARSAPVAAKSRTSAPKRPASAPGRISLDKESILNMSPAQAKSALRRSTVNTFYRKGKQGLYLFALLLIVASQPVAALNWGAYGAAMKNNTRHLAPAAKSQASSTATKVVQQANLAWVAYFTKSGTATSAAATLTIFQDNYGKFLLTLALIAFMVREYFHYKVRRGNQNLAMLTLKSQERTVQLLVARLAAGQQPLVANMARPALNAGPAPMNLALLNRMPNRPRIRR
jgi:hypothetical protein